MKPAVACFRALFPAPLLLSLLAATWCLAVPVAQSASRDETIQKIRNEVRAQNFEAALDLARALVKQNPRDWEARNWIARIQSWRGNFQSAEELYRQIIRDHPGDAEAALGLADVLVWQGKLDGAREVLLSLEKQRPNDLEVLVRLGRVLVAQNRPAKARRYFRKVLQIDPNNEEVKKALTGISDRRSFELETGYFLEGYDFARNTNGTFTQLAYRDYDRKTVLGGFQYQNKFGENDLRFTLGGTYRALRRSYIRGEVSVSPRGEFVEPNQDYTFEVTQGLSHGVAGGAAIRYLNFRNANVVIPAGIVEWDAREKLHIYLRYAPAGTAFNKFQGRVWNQGAWAKGVWDLNRRFSPYALFATGAESFEPALSYEQLGRFTAHTYGGGTEIRLSSKGGFRLGYFYQKRTGSHRENWLGVSYYVYF